MLGVSSGRIFKVTGSDIERSAPANLTQSVRQGHRTDTSTSRPARENERLLGVSETLCMRLSHAVLGRLICLNRSGYKELAN